MRTFSILNLVLWVFMTQAGSAHNYTPSSGRRLPYGHWLTCVPGSDSALRTDPPFHKSSKEEEVAKYVPHFDGQFNFTVRDTWEEWVTHYGTSCSRCGETCTGRGKDRSCSCDSCSWQELETFYRPWSTQKVQWKVTWEQDPEYRRKRQEWLRQGQRSVPASLDQLFEFDPDRPLEYFLFPGEAETVNVSSGSGFFTSDEILTPSVSISPARHDYSKGIQVRSNLGSNRCDDHDFNMQATVRTGRRIVGVTPNTIEFRGQWLQGATDSKGDLTSEAAAFELTDVSALRYEGQDVVDHYKNSRVSVSLWQMKRFLWYFSTRVSSNFEIQDNLSVIQWRDQKDNAPPVATYHLNSSDLLKTRWLHNPFHLAAGQSYEVCAYILRKNNIYYQTTKFLGLANAWSEPNCALFNYEPEEGEDMRSGTRRLRDGLAKLLGFGIL